jgi:hypothetical protein
MAFPDETPLEDVLKYIKGATTSDDMPHGVTFYVDPIGLQEAEKTMQSSVTIDVEGVPLTRALDLVLKQLGLKFLVQDGMIYINSATSSDAGPLPPPTMDATPFMKREDRFERGDMSVEEMKLFIDELKMRKQIEGLSTGRGQ